MCWKLLNHWCNYATYRHFFLINNGKQINARLRKEKGEKRSLKFFAENCLKLFIGFTHDVKDVECCQRIFRARKAAAHLRLRPSNCPRRICTAAIAAIRHATREGFVKRMRYTNYELVNSQMNLNLVAVSTTHDGRRLATTCTLHQRDGNDRCAR